MELMSFFQPCYISTTVAPAMASALNVTCEVQNCLMFVIYRDSVLPHRRTVLVFR